MSANAEMDIFFIPRDGGYNPAPISKLAVSQTGNEIQEFDPDTVSLLGDRPSWIYEKGWAVYTDLNTAYALDRAINPMAQDNMPSRAIVTETASTKVADFFMKDFMRATEGIVAGANVRISFGNAVRQIQADNRNVPAPALAA